MIMQAYAFQPELMVRTPLYSLNARPSEATALGDDLFRSALLLASPPFYKELQKINFDASLLSEKQRRSVRKYLNRAVFRSTPFGLFSAVSIGEWLPQAQEAQVLQLGPLRGCIKPDYALLHSLWADQLSRGGNAGVTYRTNETLWNSGIDFRFVKKETRDSSAFFSVVSLDKSASLGSLFSFCKKARCQGEIRSFLQKKTGAGAEDITAFVDELVFMQALLPSSAPNITGTDYAERLMNMMGQDLMPPRLETCFAQAEQLSELSRRLEQQLPAHSGGSPFYGMAERKAEDGGLPARYQESILEGLHCLASLCRPQQPPQLHAFKKAFLARYDSQQVPLLEALDGQFGIGYGGLEQLKLSYGFSSDFRSTGSDRAVADLDEHGLAGRLLGEWQLRGAPERPLEVEIGEEHLGQLNMGDSEDELPPSLSVMFRLLEDRVFIESAGGASALSLAGRFGALPSFYGYTSQIARLEQEQNPGVVFAEIAHACHLHTANVNRRPAYYDYEIPLMTTSVQPEDRQIALRDLLVSVEEDRVVLRSRRLRKRILPRLSSAFNYERSSFPLFRFLCDLQHQGLKAGLHFSLASMVPGLPFYPRVVFKSAILQLAEWHLDAGTLAPLREASAEESFSRFGALCRSLRIPRYFSWGRGDNFLVFDSACKEDVLLFLGETRGQGKLVVKEFPFAEAKQTVMDIRNQPLLGQYVAALVRKGATYQSMKGNLQQAALAPGQAAAPGWIYFKIYCHPLSSDLVLSSRIWPEVRKLKKAQSIQGWFWIRYTDPDYHIRLRVKVEEQVRPAVLQSISSCLESLCRKKLVSHFQVDSYRPELGRYSAQLIREVEAVFQASSELVARDIYKNKSLQYEDETTLLEAVRSTSLLLRCFGLQGQEQATLCRQQFDAFFREFGASHVLKTELEALFRRLRQRLEQESLDREVRGYRNLLATIKALYTKHIKSGVSVPVLSRLATDVVHMHLNRLFIYDQRYFEMVCYFLLYRSLNARLHKKATARSAGS
jgi:thiopeptide-type bacteriocin biosynthesis protein